jgi:hypothetical protein
MRRLVEFVARSLVDDPGAVDVREVRSETTTVYQLHVGAPDVGRVIGKHGRTAQALRVLISAGAARDGRRAVLEIKE